MADRERLADHPAERSADHVRGLDPERVEEPGVVVGHVVERVARRARVAADRRHHVRRWATLDLRRQADVAIVEADHEVAALGEHAAEALVPVQHLGAEPHDQKERRVAAIAEGLVEDLDSVRAREGQGQSAYRPGWDHPPVSANDASPPGTVRPNRFLPTFHYELLVCGLRGHELLGTDVAVLRPEDSIVAREYDGLPWYRRLRCDRG